MEQFVICDLDGCIADNPIRAQQYRSGNFNPDTAYCSIPDDVVIEPTLELLNILTNHADIPVVFITCRQERFRELTRDWLMANLGQYGAAPLLMRPNGDQTGDAQLKPQLLISAGYDYRRAVAALDDQPSVILAWQALGIPTYQIDNSLGAGATVYVASACNMAVMLNRPRESFTADAYRKLMELAAYQREHPIDQPLPLMTTTDSKLLN